MISRSGKNCQRHGEYEFGGSLMRRHGRQCGKERAKRQRVFAVSGVWRQLSRNNAAIHGAPWQWLMSHDGGGNSDLCSILNGIRRCCGGKSLEWLIVFWSMCVSLLWAKIRHRLW